MSETNAATNAAMQNDPQMYRLNLADMRKQRSSSYLLTAAFFLQDQLTDPIPPFHESVWQELLSLRNGMGKAGKKVTQKAFTVPREHNKTTILKLFVLDSLRQDSPIAFVLYCSATFGTAANACRDIVRWLLSPEEEQLWGPGKQLKQNETEGLWILQLVNSAGQKKEVILKAVGVDKQIRGLNIFSRRPDLIVCDDIEDLDTADSGRQQMKLDEWFFGTLFKSAANIALVILIGNIIRDTTLLARLCQDPAWNPTNYGAIVRGEGGELMPLWPVRHTVESLLDDYRAYRRIGLGHVWESEMMNLSRDISLADSIPQSCIVPTPSPQQVTAGFIVVDPAFGIKAQNDESAITVHVQVPNSPVPVLVDSAKGRWKERQLFEQVLDLVYTWGLTTVVIEAIAAQRLLIPLFKSFMLEAQMNQEALYFMPLVGQREMGAKASRIQAFRNSLHTGNYAIADSQNEVRIALEEWNAETSKHDDLPDSASMGSIVWASVGQVIESRGGYTHRIGELLFGNELGMNHGISELQTSLM